MSPLLTSLTKQCHGSPEHRFLLRRPAKWKRWFKRFLAATCCNLETGWLGPDWILLVDDRWVDEEQQLIWSGENPRIAMPLLDSSLDIRCNSLWIRKFGNFMRQVGPAMVDIGLINSGCMIYKWVWSTWNVLLHTTRHIDWEKAVSRSRSLR